MANYKYGNMWSAWEEADLFVITTNSTLKKNNAVVMGRGIAKQARDKFPGLDLAIGSVIKQVCGSGGYYGFLTNGGKMGIFQVKYHWRDTASLVLILRSTADLLAWIEGNPDKRVDLNFPGIGNGGLSIGRVKPIIDVLPDNVNVWQYKI